MEKVKIWVYMSAMTLLVLGLTAGTASAFASPAPVNLGNASNFTVLGGTTVTNTGASVITGDLGVSPGTAITGFNLMANTIMGPGTVTAGDGIVNGTIYAGGPVAAAAHNDAGTAYNNLSARVPNTTYPGVTQLNGMTFTPGVYKFAPSANLAVNGNLYLDFQGNSNAVFIFQTGSTLVTMAGSNVIALNNPGQTCIGSNVYWAVGSSATIDGAQFLGTVIATTAITMTSGANVSGRMLALGAQMTMINDTIATCGSPGGGTVPPTPKGSISGMKFNDLNGNGVKDMGEPGLANWTITLTNQRGSIVKTVTDVNGNYSFTNLAAGTYVIREQLKCEVKDHNVKDNDHNSDNNVKDNDHNNDNNVKDNDHNNDNKEKDNDNKEKDNDHNKGNKEKSKVCWIQTAPATGNYTVTITSGANITGLDFGNFKLGEIHGMNFEDLNANGVRDHNEPGLARWKITINGTDTITGTPVNLTTTTDASGNYSFTNLKAGTYVISEQLKCEKSKVCWIQTAPATGNYTVTITSGANITGLDFGNFMKTEKEKENKK
jgi:hypothetical protein